MMTKYIPDDLLSNILSHLPTKSLLRFKTVCKRWRLLIEDPTFAYFHLDQSKKTNNARGGYTQLLWQSYCYDSIRFCSIDENSVPVETFPAIEGLTWWVRYIPSCNGLICYSDANNGLHVCNPVTRETLTLPTPCSRFSSHTYYNIMVGLGFDMSTMMYKIISWTKTGFTTGIMVCTLGAKSWRRIDCDPMNTIASVNFVCSNGALHWLCFDISLGEPVIMSFGLGDERIGKFPHPYIKQRKNTPFILGEVDGRLCVTEGVIVEEGAKSLRLWVLTEYTKQEWVCQSILLPAVFHPGRRVGYGCIKSVENGGSLIQWGGEDYICRFNVKGELIKTTKVTGLPKSDYVQIHVGSLVSLREVCKASTSYKTSALPSVTV